MQFSWPMFLMGKAIRFERKPRLIYPFSSRSSYPGSVLTSRRKVSYPNTAMMLLTQLVASDTGLSSTERALISCQAQCQKQESNPVFQRGPIDVGGPQNRMLWLVNAAGFFGHTAVLHLGWQSPA